MIDCIFKRSTSTFICSECRYQNPYYHLFLRRMVALPTGSRVGFLCVGFGCCLCGSALFHAFLFLLNFNDSFIDYAIFCLETYKQNTDIEFRNI
jgi:hypothetical protein